MRVVSGCGEGGGAQQVTSELKAALNGSIGGEEGGE